MQCLNLLFPKTANKSLRLILCFPLIIATRRSNRLWIRTYIRSDTMKPKQFWIQIWWYIPNFPHDIKIRLALSIFLFPSDVSKPGCNKKFFQWGQSYFYTMRKVWYHQIWIQNYFGFIVLIQTYLHMLCYALLLTTYVSQSVSPLLGLAKTVSEQVKDILDDFSS